MPTVDKDAVKTLAIAIGLRPAARRLGLSEDRVLQWSHRHNWFPDPVQPILPPTVTKNDVISVIKPAEALQNVLAERKTNTKLGLSKYVQDASSKLAKSKGNLRNSRPAKDIADVMTKLWPEQSGSGNTINLALLCDQAAIQVVTEPKPQD